MKSLLLTLGHNSSAILAGPDFQTIGYEQERLDQIKSSSQFPLDAITSIMKYGDFSYKAPVFISHWFDYSNDALLESKNKYFNHDFMRRFSNLIFTDKGFTHHDAHAWSAYSFFEYFNNRKVSSNVHYIVADGFGNNQEVLSIYQADINLKPKLIFRANNYRASLGLMYQYATSFCGMKENQDEYKFLGYESFIEDVLDENNISILQKNIDFIVKYLLQRKDEVNENKTNEMIDFILLNTVKQYWHNVYVDVLKSVVVKDGFIKERDEKGFNDKVIIAYFIQSVIEKYFSAIIDIFSIKNVILSGGCFYNVKLNNSILKKIEGFICVTPLAGDQGAAIGMYEKNIGGFNWGDLCWGKRNLYGIEKYHEKDNILVLDKEKAVGAISDLLRTNSLVNVINENMEFGPRALCNTSTLMFPNKQNVEFNNFINNRNERMPCAPVILKEKRDFFFKDSQYNRVIGGDKFMIVTYDYRDEIGLFYDGVRHIYPNKKGYSGRPQCVSGETLISQVLKNVGNPNYELNTQALVNTSFNVHGRPICYDTSSIIQNYMYQRMIAKNINKADKLHLVIVKNEQ